jgi:cation transport ATPase
VAKSITAEVEMDEVHADLLPQDKGRSYNDCGNAMV